MYVVVDGKRRYVDYCEYCGAFFSQAGDRDNQCVVCSARYSEYLTCKRNNTKHPSQANTVRLNEIFYVYTKLKRQGFKVPNDVP